MGGLYLNSNGVQQDYIKAKKLFEKSCDKKERISCNVLGTLYAEGKGVTQNQIKAKEYFEKSCQLGANAGCDNLKIWHKNNK